MDTKLEGEGHLVQNPRLVVIPPRRTPKSTRFAQLVLLVCAVATVSVFKFSSYFNSTPAARPVTLADPADEWKDDTWPIREQTPWDISTDFPFPRSLEYTVDEGTWLRLDVHPTTGDIVFDILGDIYCLSGHEYTAAIGTNLKTKARPVLLGVPHDSDPRFSPDGNRLLFRSDAELGLENIWVTEWKGCEAADVRSTKDDLLVEALETQREEEELLANGVKETDERKLRRLRREGRLSGELSRIVLKVLFLTFAYSPPRDKRDLSLGV